MASLPLLILILSSRSFSHHWPHPRAWLNYHFLQYLCVLQEILGYFDLQLLYWKWYFVFCLHLSPTVQSVSQEVGQCCSTVCCAVCLLYFLSDEEPEPEMTLSLHNLNEINMFSTGMLAQMWQETKCDESISPKSLVTK